ncbi:hypothetical protein IAD21_02443 [Abditibacteriota bacterium]|nr:hypothetical protein IAD21_02443 [Abditibacteriota bacterium]
MKLSLCNLTLTGVCALGSGLIWGCAATPASYTVKQSVLPASKPTIDIGIDPSSCRLIPRSKVSLCWNANDAIFPQAKKFAMSATPLSVAERKRALQIVEQALLRYPAPLLQQNLKAVFVVETLHFRGIEASGTYGSDRVYIADGGEEKNYTSQWITQVFHEEFSSELLWRHQKLLDKAVWQACNLPDFHYGGDGVGAIKNATDSTQPLPEWWAKGFICQYATASMEEDFNQLVTYLFSNLPSDRPALAASPQLRRKAVLVKNFYHKIGMDIDTPVDKHQSSKAIRHKIVQQ